LSLTDDKATFFDDLLAQYERDFEAFSRELKRLLGPFIRTGPHTAAEVRAFFQGTGINEVAANFVNQYDTVIQYTQQVATQAGIPLVLPERSLTILSLFKDNQVQNILNASIPIQQNILDASFRYGIEESRLGTIIAELSRDIDIAGRRIISEAFTGASMYDRTIKFGQFKNAGVDLYFYDGPVDGKNRKACEITLGDSRQSTGWTLDGIAGSETPFIACGGYNCRHEWLPFVSGLDDLIKEMQRDAGIVRTVNL